MLGGQVIDIAEFTNWPDNARVSGSVCYSWGNEDTPFEFNQHMEVQSALIADGRSGGEGDAFYLGRAFAELKWEAGATTAPGSCWDNYVFPGRQSTTNSDACQYYDYTAENEGFLQHTYHANPVPRTLYVPGLTAFMAINPDAHPIKNLLPHDDPDQLGSFDPNQNTYSTGADCSGFVCEAAEYAGNPYQLGRVSTKQLATTSWLISEGTARANEQPTGLDLVVPGDILVLSGVHVAIVQSVTRGVDGRVTRDCI